MVDGLEEAPRRQLLDFGLSVRLHHFADGNSVVPQGCDDLIAGAAPDAAAKVWAARETIRSALAAELPARLRESALWWDRVLGR